MVNMSKIMLCLMAILSTSCSSVVLLTKTHQTSDLMEANWLLQSMGSYNCIWSDVIDADDSSRHDDIVATKAARHRANFRKLYTLIEIRRGIFDYTGLIGYGKATWQTSDRRYQFQIGVRDKYFAASDKEVISWFYLYTDVNGVIVEKKPVTSNL